MNNIKIIICLLLERYFFNVPGWLKKTYTEHQIHVKKNEYAVFAKSWFIITELGCIPLNLGVVLQWWMDLHHERIGVDDFAQILNRRLFALCNLFLSHACENLTWLT